MICIVDYEFGDEPANGEPERRSFAQIEYDVARNLRKPVFVLLSDEDAPAEPEGTDEACRLNLQKLHIGALKANHVWHTFSPSSLDGVRAKALEIALRIQQECPAPRHVVENVGAPFAGMDLGTRSSGADPRLAASELSIAGFSGQPAIAVLPFENQGGAPDDVYFAEGVADELIAKLSRWRILPVIARSSSFAYGSRPNDIKAVGRELGARYLVTGGVRRAGGAIRISVELSDAGSGRQLWSDRYERDLTETFAVQDEIAKAVFEPLVEIVDVTERVRSVQVDPAQLDLWGRTQRGLWHLFRFTAADTAIARREYAEPMTKITPPFARAFSLLAATHFHDLVHGWSTDWAEALSKAATAAKTSVDLDPLDPTGQTALGFAFAFSGKRGQAIDAFQRALALNPSFALAWYGLGIAHLMNGMSAEALEGLSTAIRLSPRDPMAHLFLLHLAEAHFLADRYDQVILWAERSARLKPEPAAYCLLLAGCGYQGDIERARRAESRLFELRPSYRLDEPGLLFSPSLRARLGEGWRLAGYSHRLDSSS